MKGARLVAHKLLKSAGWGTEGTEVGKGIKKTNGVLPEEGLVKEKEEAKKEVNGFQQNNDPSRTVYALQVGAFKDYSNADALKTRLIKRGYNAYVTFAGSESKERIFKLYKVWIGEFKDMENAERVAIEIEKAEGMQEPGPALVRRLTTGRRRAAVDVRRTAATGPTARRTSPMNG